MSSFCFAQQERLDELKNRINKPVDSILIDSAIIILKKLYENEDYKTILHHTEDLIKRSKKIKFDNGTGYLYKIQGNTYNEMGKYQKSLTELKKSDIFFTKTNNSKQLANNHLDKGKNEYYLENLEKTNYHILEAKLLFEKNKDTTSNARLYHALGRVYSDLDSLELGIKYYRKAITYRKNEYNNWASLLNIANNLNKLEKIDSAKTLLHQVARLSKKYNKYKGSAYAYENLGYITLDTKEYKDSEKFFKKSLFSYQKLNDSVTINKINQRLAIIALRKYDFKKAERLLIETRNEAKKLGYPPILLTNYKFSATLDSARGNFQKAFEWQKKYQELSDKTKLEESSKKIEKTETRYKAEMEQLKLIDEQKSKAKKAKEELLKYRIITFISLGVLFVILIFMHFIIKTRKERKQYIKQLAESNQVKNKLFSIISHDLKNEIHSLDGSLNLMKDNTISTEEFKEIVPLLANRTHQTSILLNNLLNWSKSQMKELHAKPNTFDIVSIIQDKFNFFKAKADQKNIKLINQLDTTMVFADKDMFEIVVQNLIANAIKFCNPGDSITLFSKEKEDHYEICFEDTGVGIAPDNLDKLFAEDTFTTDGTQQETGTGLGLRICKELIEINKGKINVKSKLNAGSTFYVYLPKAQLI